MCNLINTYIHTYIPGTYIHTYILYYCAVMCNLINIHTYIHILYIHTRYIHTYIHTYIHNNKTSKYRDKSSTYYIITASGLRGEQPLVDRAIIM